MSEVDVDEIDAHSVVDPDIDYESDATQNLSPIGGHDSDDDNNHDNGYISDAPNVDEGYFGGPDD